MTNPYTKYYLNQAGSGISVYHGAKYQKGHGFFGRLFKGAVVPILKYLGRHALDGGVQVAEDVLDGKDFKTSAKQVLKDKGQVVGRAAIKRLRELNDQTGDGLISPLVTSATSSVKRKRKAPVKKPPKRKTIKGKKPATKKPLSKKPPGRPKGNIQTYKQYLQYLANNNL